MAYIKKVKTKESKKQSLQQENDNDFLVLEKPIRKYKKRSNISKLKTSLKDDYIEPNINLIPDDISTIPNQSKRMVIIMLVSSFTFLLIIFSFIGLFLYRNNVNKNLIQIIKENESLDYAYLNYKKTLEPIKTFKSEVSKYEEVYNKNIYWSNLLKFLEKNTVKDVYYKDLFAESDGVITIKAVTNSYSNISNQINVFSKNTKYIKEVRVENIRLSNLDDDFKNNFDIILTINKDLLLKNE